MALSRTASLRLVWVLRLLLAAVFAGAAYAKLSGQPMMVQVFAAIGVGQWFRVVTGLVEATGALLLLVPAAGFYGASLLFATMLCAVATHLFVIGGNAVPAVVLCVLTGAVAWALRPSSDRRRRPD